MTRKQLRMTRSWRRMERKGVQSDSTRGGERLRSCGVAFSFDPCVYFHFLLWPRRRRWSRKRLPPIRTWHAPSACFALIR